MQPIVRAILYPWVLAIIVFSIAAIVNYREMKKRIIRRNKDLKRRKKMIITGCLCMILVSFSFAVYDSFDLILQDYVTEQGYYLREYRDRLDWNLHFEENGEVKTIFATHGYDELVPGTQYEYTYAKRTNMLLDIHEVAEKQ